MSELRKETIRLMATPEFLNERAVQIAFPLMAGAVFAAILTVIGWKKDASESEWHDDPRFKALSYGLVGLVVAVIGDWKSIFHDLRVERSEFVLLYGAGFIIGTVATLLFSTVGCMIASPKGHRLEDAIHFLFVGYGPWRDQRLSRNNTQTSTQREVDRVVTRYRTIGALISDAMAANILATLNVLRDPDGHTASDACERVLGSIGPIVEFAVPQIAAGSVNANLMLAVPFDDILTKRALVPSFTWEHDVAPAYGHGLVLTCYANHDATSAPPDLVLPVENRQIDGWEDRVLPGAPKAFLSQELELIGRNEVAFGSGVPTRIQEEIRRYFDGQNFNFFISLIIPIRTNGHPIGVVNIEGRLKRGESLPDEKEVDFLKGVLHPICSTLGMLAVQTDGLWP